MSNEYVLSRSSTEALTGARALASWWVLAFHLFIFANSLWGNPHFQGFATQGYLGVDFFFVLSGFILSLQYMSQMAKPTRPLVARFLLLRLARIYPVHVFMMFAIAAMAGLGALVGKVSANPDQMMPLGAVANLLLIHSWGWLPKYSWNEPSWSISCEWFAYLCFPLLAVALNRVRKTSSAWLACLLPVLVMIGVMRLIGLSSVGGTLRYGLLRIAGEFVAGCGAFLVCRSGAASRLPSWSPYAVFACICAAIALNIADPVSVPLFALLIVGLVMHPRSLLARFLATPTMVYMGELSYSLYMVNQRVILWINRVFPIEHANQHSATFRAVMAVLLLGAIVGSAAIVYHVIETPCRNYARKFIDRRFPSAARRALPPNVQPAST